MIMEQRLKKILNEVAGIGQMLEQMKKGGPIPQIEIDLILEKTRRLYEDVQGLNSIPEEKVSPPLATDAHAQAVVDAEPVAGEPAPAEPVPETSPPQAGAKEETEILADRYKEGKKFINESLSRNGNQQDITSKLQSKPIKNIQSALGINDRFQLIKDLFNGDKESFEKTISTLDEAGNFNDAFSYINSTFDWDMEDEPVQMLLDLVRRKFIMNQDEQAGT